MLDLRCLEKILFSILKFALEEVLQDFSARDKERRKNRSDEDIEASMISHVDKLYAQILQSKKDDGLIFKDINSSNPFFYRRCAYR